jgi:hypothetical protein
MYRDFGPGLTVDELIGMTAFHITRLDMPREKIFQDSLKAAKILVDNNFESSILLEIWEDGHTGWREVPCGRGLRVTPSGRIERSSK